MAITKGFFSSEQLHTVGINGPSSGECEECLLYKGCKSPRLGVAGEGRKRILIVGQYPSATADKTGDLLSGTATELLRGKLVKHGIDLDKDCWKTETVSCNPGLDKNGKPKGLTRKQIKACKPRLLKAISELKPLHVWLMGDDAITSYFMERVSKCSATKFRAMCIPDPDRKVWVTSMFHPSYIQKNEKDDHLAATFDRDLSFAVKCSKYDTVPEHVSLGKCVTILKEYDDVVRELERVLEQVPERLAFDYETTGLRPFENNHKIASISFCYDYDKAFTFPYQYNKHFTPEQINHIGDLWIDIMIHKDIKKVIQNQQYEDLWTRILFGCDISNKYWCTMNATHILDNRREFTGLKFQAFIRWGIPDYDSSMEKYLKDSKDSPYNKIMDTPLNDLLLYGGIDSLLTYRLQEEQSYEFEGREGLIKAREANLTGLNTLTNIQENGICIDRKYYEDQDVILEKRIKDMENALYKFPEAIKFERVKKRPINFGSSQDLAELFFTILELPKGKQTAGGNDCTDAGVLAELETPIAKELTKISKLKKIKGTYLGQFLRESGNDDRLHPSFSLHTTVTGRSSSSSPNFQNIPVRDKDAMNITRGGIIPEKGSQLVDWDYGAMEVRIIAAVTQDPVLVTYCNDVESDMHRDQAMDSFSFTLKEWLELQAYDKKNKTKCAKDIRFHAKNGEVFAWFYGSYYGSSAKSLFPLLKELKVMSITLYEWLCHKGIIKSSSTAYKDFENHLKLVEKRFWNKYKQVKLWQESQFKSYLRIGHIELITGHRCSGWLSRNDICNYHIQGPAYHCLQWSLDTLDSRMREEKMFSLLIGQIHDCCLGSIIPDELTHWCSMSKSIGTLEIRQHYKWLNCLLLQEFEKGEIDEPWSLKREFDPFKL